MDSQLTQYVIVSAGSECWIIEASKYDLREDDYSEAIYHAEDLDMCWRELGNLRENE